MDIHQSIQEEILELEHNEGAKIDFIHNGYELFWLGRLWKVME